MHPRGAHLPFEDALRRFDAGFLGLPESGVGDLRPGDEVDEPAIAPPTAPPAGPNAWSAPAPDTRPWPYRACHPPAGGVLRAACVRIRRRSPLASAWPLRRASPNTR